MGTQTNYLLNVRIENRVLYFGYHLSETPDDHWWAIYRGAMPSYNETGGYATYEYIRETDASSLEGYIEVPYDDFVDGSLYTIALYKDDDYNLYDYQEVIA